MRLDPDGPEGPILQRLRLTAGLAAQKSPAQAAYFDTLYADLREAWSDPQGYLAATFYVPSEVPAALGIHWLSSEPVVGAAASLAEAGAALAGGSGLLALSPGLCGYQRLLLGLVAQGLVPPPRAFAAATFMCDDAWKLYEVMAWRLGRPFYLVDVPHLAGPEATRYLTCQLRGLAGFLEAAFDCRLSQTGVKRAVGLSNEALEEKRRLDRSRRDRPGALDSGFGLRLFTQYCGFGGPRCLEVYRGINLELERRRWTPEDGEEAGEDGPGPALRLVWLGLMPLFIPALTGYLERNFRVRVVYEELSGFDWPELSAARFFAGLADKLLAQPFFGPSAARAQAVARLAREFGADAAVHLSYPNCRALPGGVPELRGALGAVGIPLLDLEAEVVDRSRYAAGSTLLALDAFMEQLGAQRRAGGEGR